MKVFFASLLLLPLFLQAQFSSADKARWQQHAKNTTIIRDNWGVPHIYGKTDADAVFGLIYAQCEDDFARVEMNYINILGRSSEVKGAQNIYEDLYTRMVIDSAAAVKDYQQAPQWLKKLLQAWSDGIHYYLSKNPNVKPLRIQTFKPWYPLMWTDGSISAISTGFLASRDVKNFYEQKDAVAQVESRHFNESQTGSNGFAIAPAKSATGNAMLYINPHTSFYFRPEVHMVSEEGLNAYGAVTWGQFFIYQGFNEYCGWMHTSSNADVSDVYKETIQQVNGKYVYRYDGKDLPIQTKQESITYVKDGQYAQQSFTVYSTGHGPVMGKQGQHWLSVKSFNRSMDGLIQSWLRTKAKGLADMRKVMEYRANTSNNTVYADAQGNIGYWHGNFMPIRDTAYDWGKAVDGTTSKTEWKGLHPATATIQVINPSNGWLQNCNSTPFTVAGSNSPKRNAYPPYMAPDGENFRGLNAVRVLSKQDKYSLEQLIAAGYDTYLTAFEILVPALVKAYDGADEATKQALAEPMKVMRAWDYRSNENSVATTLAVEWAQFQLSRAIQQVYIEQGDDDQVARTRKFAATIAPQELLKTFQNTINQLVKQHGTWNMPWGELNRFQRLNGAIDLQYDDNAASLPVGFVSSTWGSLPSFNSRYANNTKKRYGFNGNSFIAAVEFGKKLRAKSVLAGGNSSDPASPYFTNQAAMYTKGQFKDVLFYKADVLKNAVKTYHP